MRVLLILSIGVFLTFFTSAQTKNEIIATDTADYPYWIDMMQDDDANFFETQVAFEKYWEGREIERGSGYKPFKRWENMMKTRVDEFGNKPSSSKSLDAYNQLIKNSERKSAKGNWELLGPIDLPNPESGQPNGLGRINVIAFHPKSENTIYIGAPSGGFWRSFDNGSTWETTTQNLPTLGVSAIVVNPIDPNIIYMGTGDRDANDAPGLGVYKSLDGGTTWEQKNIGMGNITVNKLLIHPTYPDIVLAATEKGVYKTQDGGETWELKTSGTSKSMEFKPMNPDVVYAVKGGSLYKSIDNGESWTRLSNGLQTWSRAVVGVTPANPEFVYVLATNQRTFKALYFSDNEGEIFSTKSTTPNIMDYNWNGSGDGGQAWYDLCMAVDQKEADVIYSGGVNIFKSTDNGEGWKINAHWVGQVGYPVHADHHDMAFNPLNNRLYTANDGGLYYTDNGGSSWINISDGISISQIYKIGQSATVRDWVLAGNQDNGTSFNDKGFWRVVFGGDGMECAFDHKEEKYRYVSLYYGQIFRSTNGGSFQSITNGINDQGAWVTPYVLNENASKTMYVGMSGIWRTTSATSPSISWKNIFSNNSNSYRMVALENSPANSEILYASREDRTVFRTTNVSDATPTWKQLTSFPSAIITDIEAHPYNENIVYATASNSHVYKSTNKGGSWTKITANIPTVSLNTIAYDKTSNEGLYVGTDIGVFFKDATMTNWVYFSDGFPVSVRVTELEIYYDDVNPENNILRASTYGRGLWESALFSEEITTANNARIIEVLNPTGEYKPNDSIEGKVTIKNIGSDVLSSIKVEYQLDNNISDTSIHTVNLATYETQTVSLPKFIAGIGNHSLTIRLIDANGTVISSVNSTKFSISALNIINLNLVTDSLASQTSWRIIDVDEREVFSSETYVDDSIYHIEESFNMEIGCYKFIIDDVDGICCAKGNGSYSLSNITSNEQLGSGAEFLIADTVEFCIDMMADPDFKISRTTVRTDEGLTFENKTVDNSYTYLWNFGEGAIPQTFEGITPPEVKYSTGGYKTTTLTASNGKVSVVNTQSNLVKVYDQPIVETQPESVTICPANTLNINIIAKGYELEYSWYHNGVKISEQVDGLLKLENVQSINEGDYYCRVSNRYFSVKSDTVTVTLKALPELTVSSSDSIICNGGEVTLTAVGTGDLLWSNNLGTESSVKVTPEQSTTYLVSLKNTEGCMNTKEITVSVAYIPNITAQPENKRLCEDEGVVMVVDADGGALNYQWKIDNIDFVNGSNVLYIDSVKPEHEGDVICVVSNVCDSKESDAAYLTVDPLPIAGFSYQKTENTLQFVDEAQFASGYDWDFGDGQTSTQIEPSHTYTDGEYTILQEVDNDCGVDTMSYKISIITGVEDNLFATEQLKLYPNPAQSTFHLEYISEEYNGEVKVFMMNIEGKIIMHQNLTKQGEKLLIPFNISDYSKGLYQLQIILGDRIVSRKIIIN